MTNNVDEKDRGVVSKKQRLWLGELFDIGCSLELQRKISMSIERMSCRSRENTLNTHTKSSLPFGTTEGTVKNKVLLEKGGGMFQAPHVQDVWILDTHPNPAACTQENG